MSQPDSKDENNALGKPLRPVEMPKPYKYLGRGVWQAPDGKLETRIEPQKEKP